MLPTGLQGWPLKFVQHIADATCIYPSTAGPPGCCLPHLFHLCNLSFIIGMPNMSCILELWANECFVCLSKIHFRQSGPLKLIKTMLKFCRLYLGLYVSMVWNRYSKDSHTSGLTKHSMISVYDKTECRNCNEYVSEYH